jgi:3-deoxy-D-manno-octulosonate 8-phosphate phosphatase (KDO 8-P phosphatase)
MYNRYPPDNKEQFHNPANILTRFKGIHTFMFDVDGVMTNNQVLITEKGELLRSMNMRDGYALKSAIDLGYQIFIITGGKSVGVIERLKGLGVKDVASGVRNKLGVYEKLLDAYELEEEGILYMGDDVMDYDVMSRVGLPTCPKDAASEIINISHYISPFKGGEGCVRDVVEKVLKLNNQW